VLNASGAGSQAGRINYADDVDVFRFTATQSGTMTLRMQIPAGTRSELKSAISVDGTTAPFATYPPRMGPHGEEANDQVLQFHVVKGVQYTIRASGADGTVGDYLLSLAMAGDDFPSTSPPAAVGVPTGTVKPSGSIETPGDTDRFQFTADFDGFVIVYMD